MALRTHTGEEADPDVPSMGRLEDGVHLLPVRVYYEDTDFSGVVYHARYLHFLERGRSDYLRCAGVRHTALLERDPPLAFAVRRMELTFERPARIDDALLVRTRYRALKGARIIIDQELQRGGERLLTAEVEAVCLTLDGRPRRAPEDLHAALRPFLTLEAS